MTSLLKNIFTTKNQKVRAARQENQPARKEVHFQNVPAYSIPPGQIPATAPYHSGNSRPLPRGPRSTHNCSSAQPPRRMTRASSTEELRDRRSRSQHRYAESFYSRNPSSDSSEGEEVGWQDRLVRLEYENKKLRHRLKQSEAKVAYIQNVKKETERAFVRQIDEVEYEKSQLMEENERISCRMRQLEEQLSTSRGGRPLFHGSMGLGMGSNRLLQEDTPSTTPFTSGVDDEKDEIRCFRRPESSPPPSASESPIPHNFNQ